MIFNDITTDRGVITNIESDTRLSVSGYDNRPVISFSPGSSYTIYAPQELVVTSINSSTSLNTSRLSATAPDFDYNAGGTGGYQEFYRIKVATKELSGTGGSGSSGSNLDGGTTDFASAGVEVGDIVKNVTDASYGKITNVTGTTLTATLYGGSLNQFNAGDNYEVYYDYVNTRRYEFRVRYSGTTKVYAPGNERKRDVCLGYSSDCSTFTGTVTLPVHATSVVTIRDFDINNVEVSNASVTIPASTSGSIKVSGLDYYLHVSDDEIPGWFVRNKWHQLVYVAYSADYVPGGAGDCITNANCLTLNGYSGNDKHALVIIAGKETNTILDSSCNTIATTMQDRAIANMNTYYEMENCDPGNDIFQHASGSTTYNDQDKIIE